MLSYRYVFFLFGIFFLWSCNLDKPVTPTTPTTPTTLDFKKYVAIGDSLTAGIQGGTLYTDAQDHSFPALLAQQFALVGGGEFNQPDIDAVNGRDRFFLADLSKLKVEFEELGFSPMDFFPVPVGMSGLNSHLANNSYDEITPYTGGKSLNNFGVSGMRITDINDSQYIKRAPYFSRFASIPTATVLDDVLAALADASFFSFWLGSNDALGYALGGASDSTTITSTATFETEYNKTIEEILAANPESKGILLNLPNFLASPFFHSISPTSSLDLNDDQVNQFEALVNSHNTALSLASLFGLIDSEEENQRTLSIAVGPTAFLIEDEELSSLIVVPKVRQANADDLILPTALELIEKVQDISTVKLEDLILGDEYVITPAEQKEITDILLAYNRSIAQAVTNNAARLILVDTQQFFQEAEEQGSVDGLRLTISPEDGGFSPDMIHPNTKFYAALVNKIVEVINLKSDQTVPLLNIDDYLGNVAYEITLNDLQEIF